MFQRITFRENTDPQDEYAYAPEHHVYVHTAAWAEHIQLALTFSGYRIGRIDQNINPWTQHGGDHLWGQWDDADHLVALIDTEETSDMVNQAAVLMGSTRLGKRARVERPVHRTQREEF
jgi:hypothetical protein